MVLGPLAGPHAQEYEVFYNKGGRWKPPNPANTSLVIQHSVVTVEFQPFYGEEVLYPACLCGVLSHSNRGQSFPKRRDCGLGAWLAILVRLRQAASYCTDKKSISPQMGAFANKGAGGPITEDDMEPKAVFVQLEGTERSAAKPGAAVCSNMTQ
jgi:hypothetical protein